jgi:NAD(P)-dependent dehydrogenase (short-subunit alcohol dehydrogenase family)
MAAALAALGRIDILVSNAGIFAACPLAEMDVNEWDRIMAVNLRGTFLCTRQFLPAMLEHGYGRIINIASQLGQLGRAGAVHYSASRGGVIAFTRTLPARWPTARSGEGRSSARFPSGLARSRRLLLRCCCWLPRAAPFSPARPWARTAAT